ncbi:hypothetical protein HJFPF1_12850 [Paramyrothecium foliicola]|nr:hypothetical protein HJFPF1_12850 [Paramyrothecium foliicola]
MGQSFIDKIQAKLEIFRLEQRYTRRRHRRSTFVSNAVYVDGEYVYQTPNSTGSSVESSNSRIDALHGEKNVVNTAVIPEPEAISAPEQTPNSATERKRLHRFSSIASFGGHSTTKDSSTRPNRRLSMIR